MIKKTLGALVCLALLYACGESKDPNAFEINGEIAELADGTQVFLKRANENNQYVDVDTVQTTAGVFQFEGVAETHPEIYFVFVDKSKGNVPIVIEKGEIEITAQKDSLIFAKVKGPEQNQFFQEYLKTQREMGQRAQTMQADLQRAVQNGDTAEAEAFREEMFELQKEAKDYNQNYIKANPNSLISVHLLQGLKASRAISDEEYREMYESLPDNMKATKVGERIGKELEATKATAIGAKAPEFSAKTPSGEMVALNNLLGKVTIVDFWAAWCKPCRLENPNVVKVYEKYHDKGLNIVGVSLDRTHEAWEKAIADDNLTWSHVEGKEAANLYNVVAIPATFILDENGVIIAKNLRGQALEDKIAELLD